jgi:hypothetical protein
MAILTAALALGACSIGGDDAARPRAERTFPVGAFQTVEVAGPHDVVVSQGAATSVRAEGDAETIERLDIRVENGTLKIGTRNQNNPFRFRRHRGVTVHVTTPELTGASIAGSGDMRIESVRGEAFSASIAGSGEIEIGRMETRRARLSIAGSGGIRASGRADEAEAAIAGSGDLHLGGLALRRADVSVAGSGNIELNASEAVSGSVMGSGDVRVVGGARCDVRRMGSGSVHCAP